MPEDPDKEQLVKIVIDAYDETFGVGGEGLWAKPLGDDLYEIRNTPWHTFEVNWGDVVRAIPEKEDQKPKIVEVVRQSGHRTLHIYFFKETGGEERSSILNELHTWKASFENSDSSLYAIDFEPDGDFDAARNYLDEFETLGKLEYRTTIDG
jgi:Domain of unknown function (DUF4265)